MHIEIQNCFSFWGTSSPDPLPGLRPWTPLGDFCLQTSCTGRPPHFVPGLRPWLNGKKVSYLGVSEADEVDQRFLDVDCVGEHVGRTCQLSEHHIARLVRVRCCYTLRQVRTTQRSSLQVQTRTQRFRRHVDYFAYRLLNSTTSLFHSRFDMKRNWQCISV